MSAFSNVESIIVEYATKVPLELFSFAGSLVEEIIAPIPSPLVMTTVGSIAALQSKPVAFLLVLSILGALGKVIGASVLYLLAYKAEDLVLGKLGRIIGVSHKEVESVGKHLSNTWKDVVVLAFIRSLPFMPSSLVSVSCGLLKIRWRVFLPATFIGTIVRDVIFLYFGFVGINTFTSTLQGIDTLETLLKILMLAVMSGFFAYMYYKRGKGDLVETIRSKFGKKRK